MIAAAASLAQGGPVIPNFGRGDECVRTNGKFCLHWFLDNFDNRFLPRVYEHIEMTLIAVSIGFVIATGCLHGVGIAVGLVHRWAWGQTLLRAAGAVVALAGVFFMWRAIA